MKLPKERKSYKGILKDLKRIWKKCTIINNDWYNYQKLQIQHTRTLSILNYQKYESFTIDHKYTDVERFLNIVGKYFKYQTKFKYNIYSGKEHTYIGIYKHDLFIKIVEHNQKVKELECKNQTYINNSNIRDEEDNNC